MRAALATAPAAAHVVEHSVVLDERRVLQLSTTEAPHRGPAIIRVVLADDHLVVRAGLRALLGTMLDITVVGEATNGVDAVALVERLHPDVVVLDLDMPRMDGLAATAQLARLRSASRVLMLTMHTELELLEAVFNAGATGVLMKNVADRELAEAIRTVASGDIYLPRRMRSCSPRYFTSISLPTVPDMPATTSDTTPTFRALDDTESRAFLARHHVGRLAFSFHERVDIEPIHFTFDGDWIFGRTSMGTKLASLAHHPWCAFEADEVQGVFDWTSVVVKGTFYLLDPQGGSPDIYRRALEKVRAIAPDAFTAADPTPHRSILFGIYANEISGRRARLDR